MPPTFAVSPEKNEELRRQMETLGIREEDLEERFVRSSGKGGQHVNKSSTCVQLLHRPSGKLSYISAGHERPMLVRSGEQISQIKGNGRFLGMLDPLELDEFEVDLQQGDRLLVFSDGVPDAIDQAGRQYGYERMMRYLKKNHELPVRFLVDGLASDVAAWRGNAPAFDDLTLLALEVMADNG